MASVAMVFFPLLWSFSFRCLCWFLFPFLWKLCASPKIVPEIRFSFSFWLLSQSPNPGAIMLPVSVPPLLLLYTAAIQVVLTPSLCVDDCAPPVVRKRVRRCGSLGFLSTSWPPNVLTLLSCPVYVQDQFLFMIFTPSVLSGNRTMFCWLFLLYLVFSAYPSLLIGAYAHARVSPVCFYPVPSLTTIPSSSFPGRSNIRKKVSTDVLSISLTLTLQFRLECQPSALTEVFRDI